MSPKPITCNTLFYGDSLFILRDYLPTESIDLVYLDPPFNSNRSYNVLFKDEVWLGCRGADLRLRRFLALVAGRGSAIYRHHPAQPSQGIMEL